MIISFASIFVSVFLKLGYSNSRTQLLNLLNEHGIRLFCSNAKQRQFNYVVDIEFRQFAGQWRLSSSSACMNTRNLNDVFFFFAAF
jgi:hypothetical protein